MRPHSVLQQSFTPPHATDENETERTQLSSSAPTEMPHHVVEDHDANSEEKHNEKKGNHQPSSPGVNTESSPLLPPLSSSPSSGLSFLMLRSIVAYFPPEPPLALVACSPSVRVALELRSRGCVLPGSLRFERRLGPSAGRLFCSGDEGPRSSGGESNNDDSSNSSSSPFFLPPPPQEFLQFLTSHKPAPSRMADPARAVLRPSSAPVAGRREGGGGAITATERIATRASTTSVTPGEANDEVSMPLEHGSQQALSRALWWVQRFSLPVSLSLHRFDSDDVKMLTTELDNLPRKIVIRELSLHGQQVSDVTPFFPHCGGVRSLSLRNTHLTSEKLDLLPNTCGHVERLSLFMSSSVSSTQFLQHKALRTLYDLDLAYTQVTEDGVSRDVSTLKGLSRLSLEGCRRIEGLQWLQTLTHIRQLDLAYSSITDASLASLRSCSVLEKLDLQWCGHITDLQELVGAICYSLLELNLAETSVTNEGITPLNNFVALECISLEGCIAISDVNVLGDLLRLRELNLGRTRVTSEGVMSLSQCKALRFVRMRQCYRLTNINCLGALQQLEELDLSDCPATNEGIVALQDARSLRKLWLQSCRAVSDVNFLSSAEQLTVLDLHHTTVDDAGTAGLAQCAELTILNMHSAPVHSLQQWNTAAFLSKLTRLDLSNTRVTPDEISFLSSCPFLETLSLRGCKRITHVEFLILQRSPEVSAAAPVPPDSELLHTSSTSIDNAEDGGGYAKNNSNSGSHLTADTTTTTTTNALATAVTDNSEQSSLLLPSPRTASKKKEEKEKKEEQVVEIRQRLTDLTLSGTNVTDNGLRALRYCPRLERLRLAHCKELTDVSVLRWLPQLKELDLSATAVTSHGIAKVSPSGNTPLCCIREGKTLPEDVTMTTGGEHTPTGCVALEKLWVQSCAHLDNVRLLSGFTHLKELFLTDTPLKQKEDDLKELYRCNPMLKQIHHSTITTPS